MVLPYGVNVITPPVSPIIERDDVKDFIGLPLTGTGHDGVVDTLIAAAVSRVERIIGRTLGESTLEYTRATFPEDSFFQIPRGPVSAINSIKYDTDAALGVTMPAEDYVGLFDREPAVVSLVFDASWPADALANSVVVNYDAGFATLPGDLKLALMQLCFDWFDFRGENISGSIIGQVPGNVADILANWSLGDEFAEY